MVTAQERYSRSASDILAQKQKKSALLAELKKQQDEYYQTEEGKQQLEYEQYQQDIAKLQSERNLQENSDNFVVAGKQLPKDQYIIEGRDDDTPNEFIIKAKPQTYEYEPAYSRSTKEYSPEIYYFEGGKLVSKQTFAVGGYEKRRKAYASESVIYSDDRKITTNYKIVGKGTVKKTSTFEELGTQKYKTYERDMSKYREDKKPELTETDISKISQTGGKARDDLTPSQLAALRKLEGSYKAPDKILSKASLLTHEAQVKEFGRVITPTRSRFEVEAEVRGKSVQQLKRISTLTPVAQAAELGVAGLSQKEYKQIKERYSPISFVEGATTLFEPKVAVPVPTVSNNKVSSAPRILPSNRVVN